MNDIFKKSVLSVAVRAALVGTLAITAAGCNLAEGDRSTSTSTSDATQPVVNQVTQLKGTVTGFVFDTNGKAVANARVVLAGQVQTTTADGSYSFADVTVTNVKGADGDISQTELVVSITADGHASATVVVEPSAQVEGSNNNANGGDDDTTQQTFVDGFLAQATNAVLPKYESTVKGRLKLPTGQPLPGATVVLDFNGVISADGAEGGGNTNTQSNNSVSLGVPTYKAVTDAQGYFTFTSVAADSNFKLLVEGWSSNGSAQCESTATTPYDDTVHTLADIQCMPFSRNDTTAPVVYNVSPVANPNANGAEAILAVGIDGTAGITVRFSESLQQLIEADKVYAYSQTNQVYKAIAGVTQSADGFSATVTFADPIEQGEVVQILIPKAHLHDLAGNSLNTTESAVLGGALVDPRIGAADLGFTGDQTTEYAKVVVKGYQETSTNAVISAVQSWSEAIVDAFEDTMGLVTGTQQLNADGVNADDRLYARLDAEDDGSLNATADGVFINKARISVELTSGTGFNVVVTDSTGAAKNVDFLEADDTLIDNDDSESYDADVTDVYLGGVVAGDIVTFIPFDDFGNVQADQNVTVTLVDAVAPTTALQESYGLGDTLPLVVAGGTVSDGDGGENSNTGTSATAGSPILHVTPRILAGSDANWFDDVDDTGVFGNLTAGITGAANQYSAANWTAFAATSQNAKVGVAFTEPVALVAGQSPAWAGDAAVTAWAAFSTENVADSSDTIDDGVEFDGVTFNVARVLDLAADARTANNQFSFTGAVQDTTGNVAATDDRAQVAVADAIPPFVTSATFTADALTITFNEPVQAGTNSADLLAMTLNGTALSTEYNAVDVSVSVDGLTVTFDNDDNDGAGADDAATLLTINNLFSDGVDVNDELNFAESGAATLRGHAVLDFGNVKDVEEDQNIGVSWNEYLTDSLGAASRLDMDAIPQFLVANLVGPFSVTESVTGVVDADVPVDGDDDGVATLTLTFSHPVLLTGVGSFDATYGDNNGTLTSAEILAELQIDLDGAGAGAAAALDGTPTASFSADGRVLTIVLDEADDAIQSGVSRVETVSGTSFASSITGAEETLSVVVSNR